MGLCWTENPPQAGTCQELPIWKTKPKTWMLYINGSWRVIHTGTVHARTHTRRASQCKWRGLLEMKEGLTLPLVRDHCPPFCYSVLWSCGKQMTSEPQRCVQLQKKRKGEGEAVLWEGERPPCPVFQTHPHRAIPVHSTEVFLMPPAPAAALSATKVQSRQREQGTLPHQHKGLSHLLAWLVTWA